MNDKEKKRFVESKGWIYRGSGIRLDPDDFYSDGDWIYFPSIKHLPVEKRPYWEKDDLAFEDIDQVIDWEEDESSVNNEISSR